MTCIDLKALFGERFMIDKDPAAKARNHDPWMHLIPCREGNIYPIGGSRIAAYTERRGWLPAKLAAIPGAEILQDGDDGVTVAVDVGQIDALAQIMGAKRRRKPA